MALNVPTLQGELDGYPQSEWYDGEFRAVRRLVVGWDDVRKLLDQLDSPPDDQYPYPEGTPNALARRARTFPYSAQTNPASAEKAHYDLAIVEVHYSTRGPQWHKGNLIHEYLEPAGGMHGVNHANLRWNSNAGVPAEAADNIRRMEYAYDYCIKFHRLLAPPQWLAEATNCINLNVVVSPTLGWMFRPYSLLFKGVSVGQTVSPAGGVTHQSVTARFGLHPDNNWFLHWKADGGTDGTGQYAGLFIAGAGGGQYRAYRAVNFLI